ncbi:VPLPA-CTERM sorting domain-containing protein [Palleronia sp. LCG004]|uniref:alpha/beta hydrolase family protein n=1 Tax=Palleronia sp. LCG004 TaxID=3079304 RepID=UPI0029424863|nr:VPLPA-CTERM sorting domain-containing protein [Palleronia sp. LCG004]WOI57677.1 VPLPA-CTERM sorting domain-containing protein [Palleronia sp. LCG004]
MSYRILATVVAATTLTGPVGAENRIDGQSPLAPELSNYGEKPVGVRQIDFVNKDEIDILAVDPSGDRPESLPRYDRPLSVEMWYPAAEGSDGDTSLKAYLRDGTTEVTLEGRAIRDAAPAASETPYPLLILSHGYPGNRFLMSHLGENLASKGYVVASIDHTDSTYRDQAAFASTLVNRPLDQRFVLDEMAKLNRDAESDFAGMIDADNTGVIGYSMGGYGAVINAGAGVTEAAAGFAPQGTLAIHQAGSDSHEALDDPRIKTAAAIGPWGMNAGFWDAEGLEGIDMPMLFLAGSDDATSLYEDGIRAIWEGAVNVDRTLVTFEGGGHSVAAPMPAPEEAYYFNDALGFDVSAHYNDPVWDQVRSNNIAQHFLTAWMNLELKGDNSMSRYLDLPELGDLGNWAGFDAGEAQGLRYEILSAGEVSAAIPLPASIWLMGLGLAGLGAMRSRRRDV